MITTDKSMAGPPALPLPKLAAWMACRRMNARALAAAIGVSRETARRWCLPFGDVGRRIPDEGALEKIVSYTAGEVTAESFYPAALRARPADEDHYRPRDFMRVEDLP